MIAAPATIRVPIGVAGVHFQCVHLWVLSLCADLRWGGLQVFIARQPAVAQFDDALAVARVLFGVRDLHDGGARRD